MEQPKRERGRVRWFKDHKGDRDQFESHSGTRGKFFRRLRYVVKEGDGVLRLGDPKGNPLVIPGDDVDTDVMYPGRYLNIEDPEEMKPYLFEGYDPTLRDRLGPETIVVT